MSQCIEWANVQGEFESKGLQVAALFLGVMLPASSLLVK
jgi:hypothetical protein